MNEIQEEFLNCGLCSEFVFVSHFRIQEFGSHKQHFFVNEDDNSLYPATGKWMKVLLNKGFWVKQHIFLWADEGSPVLPYWNEDSDCHPDLSNEKQQVSNLRSGTVSSYLNSHEPTSSPPYYNKDSACHADISNEKQQDFDLNSGTVSSYLNFHEPTSSPHYYN